MDVKNAFLHSYLSEEVYMQPPFVLPHSLGQVCKLRRALYGLKQAPRAWFKKFSITVIQYRFSQSARSSVMFTSSSKKGIVILLIYIDDMIIIGDDLDRVYKHKT